VFGAFLAVLRGFTEMTGDLKEKLKMIQRFWNARGKISHPLMQISFKQFMSLLEASGISWVIPNDSLVQLFKYTSLI